MRQTKELVGLMLVVPLLFAVGAGASERREPRCPKMPKHRTAAEVFASRQAALARGDIDLAFCHYAEDAVVMMPGSVIHGREQAKAGFLQFGSLFGGRTPTVTSVTTEGEVVLVTFTVAGPGASIPDGADTFIIRDGLIQKQVVHATIHLTATP